ncbi:MAG TPA: TonB-dependent receptor, partial [Calditrichia bacterium]|nr:TonB-dependent receptor [Calditrichia bacterium]
MILPTKPGVRLGILPALILIIFGAMAHPPSGAKLSGTVRNETGEAMAGVAIYLAELNLGAESDASGHFEIPNLPRGHHLVEFSHIGYKTVVRPVDLAGKGAELQIDLVTSPVPSHPVVVSAPYQRTPEQTPYTLARLDRGEIQFSPAITLTEALTRVPGISQISTGTGITKPVIRGLH